jgi:hypothetical protein
MSPTAADVGGIAPASTDGKKRDHSVAPIPAPILYPTPGSVPSAASGSGGGDQAAVRPGTGDGEPGAGETGADEMAAAGEAGSAGGAMPPSGMPGGASNRGEERSDASGLLSGTETSWADPDNGDLPSDSQGTAAGGASLAGAQSGAAGVLEEQPEDRVAVVPSAVGEDTSAWEAADLAALWPIGGRGSEDEEDDEYLPKYVLSDDDGWADEADGAVSAAGVGGDEDGLTDGAATVPMADEEGWAADQGDAVAAGLGLLSPSAKTGAPAEPVAGPSMATWRPDRSAAKEAADEVPMAAGYAGMLCGEGVAAPDEGEADSANGALPMAGAGRGEDDEEEEKSRGIADLLKEGPDQWGAGDDFSDILG